MIHTKPNNCKSGVQIRKGFDLSVIVKYSYYFTGGGGGGLLVELQWYVYQNKVAVGFLEIIFYSVGKVTNQSSDILQHPQNRPTGDRWLKFQHTTFQIIK